MIGVRVFRSILFLRSKIVVCRLLLFHLSRLQFFSKKSFLILLVFLSIFDRSFGQNTTKMLLWKQRIGVQNIKIEINDDKFNIIANRKKKLFNAPLPIYSEALRSCQISVNIEKRKSLNTVLGFVGYMCFIAFVYVWKFFFTISFIFLKH